MGRQVVTQAEIKQAEPMADEIGGRVAGVSPVRPAETKPTEKADGFADRLLKYIPTEVVAVYITLDGLFRTAPPTVPTQTLLWLAFLVLTIGTWLYLARVQEVKKTEQLVISTVAFVIWVFSLGGPFSAYTWYTPFYGAVLLPLYTFVIPIVEAKR